ncbi:hypothetical protein PR003_g6503 [Phytophthora rubi]|uniref:Vinculin n=1 Tax=Phytophthora rubi TaxID=129364 RepID=A0A6A3NDM9_9STRA|nr:hypothetical protein PR002_g8381 [Phytophthora rubi]KAE9042422.1 hypothetical protein PR001_g6202 [Phytophthora rubi]KAE9348277.1 hypothetical protein PR003_g6503 [Phytophthora rubi]
MARMPVDPSSKEQLSGFEKQRSELLQAALVAETTAMAFATRRNDVRQVVDRSAAVLECMGGQIAVMVPAHVRASILRVISDAAKYIKGSATQMMMYSDDEADDALRETQVSVKDANASLDKNVSDVVEISPAFADLYSRREKYTTLTTTCLENLYWMK